MEEEDMEEEDMEEEDMEAPSVFWGLNVVPGKTYSQVVDRDFHISNAALGEKIGKEKSRTTLFVKVGDEDYALCHLTPGVCEQAPLAMQFQEGEEITFHVKGDSSVSLIGNFSPEDGPNFDDLDGDEDEDEEGFEDVDDDEEMDEEENADFLEQLKRKLGQTDRVVKKAKITEVTAEEVEKIELEMKMSKVDEPKKVKKEEPKKKEKQEKKT